MICNEQYNYDNSLSSYRCKVNGNDGGKADYWLPYTTDFYILRWVLDNPAILNNEKPVFEFYHTSKNHDNIYWYAATSNNDVNGDGSINHLRHSNSWMYEGLYTGTTGSGTDLVYRFWYTDVVVTDEDYNDLIVTNKDSYYAFEDVYIDSSTSDISYLNSIHAYYYYRDNWVEYTGQGYPDQKEFLTYSFSTVLQPSFGYPNASADNWNITLERGGSVVAYKTFNVTNLTEDADNFIITTYPNPSKPAELVTVHYVFNHEEHSTGRIVLSSSPYSYDTTSFLEVYNIDYTGEDNLTFLGTLFFESEGIYYLHMMINTTSTTWYNLYTKKHICKAQEYNNLLDVELNNYGVGDSAIIDYQHNHLGSLNIFIIVNDLQLSKDISLSSTGVATYLCQEEGQYIAQLILRGTGTEYQVLAFDNFTVSGGEIGEDSIPDLVDQIFSEEQQVIIGIFMVIFITFLPFMVTLKLKQQHVTIDIPNILYGISFGCGVVITYVTGFLPFEIMFFLIFILVSMIALLWLYGKRKGGGE
jgi:hypothetical protein